MAHFQAERKSTFDQREFALGDLERLRGERELYFHYPHYSHNTSPVSATRRGNWKLLHYYEDRRVELYDLMSDPGEETNLLAGQAEVAEKMSARLASWLNESSVQFPSKNEELKPD